MYPILSFFRENPAITNLVTFVLLVLAAMIIARSLLFQLVYAFAPESKKLRFVIKPRLVRVALALADIGAWLLAVMISCLAHKLTAISQLLLSVFGIFWNLLPLTIIVVLITFCFSRNGNELILSLIGGWYLPYRKPLLDRYRYFDLGDDEEGEIEAINLLETTFRLKKGGQIVLRNNAFLMHEVFGFSRAIGIEGIVDKWQKLGNGKKI